jgi:phosphate starvation-inducible protein PhoH and related proteins
MREIKPRSQGQENLIATIDKNTFTFVVGYAGVGKSLISLYQGLKAIKDSASKIRQIIVIRPFIKNKLEHDFGALPGTIEEKMYPLGGPILDNLQQLLDHDTELNTLFDDGTIELIPMGLLRGRTFENKYIIVEEAQNLRPDGVYSVMSRVGKGSKCVVCGDLTQADINRSECDLERAINILSTPPLKGVGIVRLYQASDIQRNPLLYEIMKRFNKLDPELENQDPFKE